MPAAAIEVTIETKAGNMAAASLWFKLMDAGFEGVSFDTLPCKKSHQLVIRAPSRRQVKTWIDNSMLSATVKK